MVFNELIYDRDGAVATVRLNRPHVYNAVSLTMLGELNEALKRAEQDAAVRVVVLTGEGAAFCSGADLAGAVAETGNGPDLGKVLVEHYNPVILRMRAMRKPVVAAVNGPAAGAGANLALMADLTICAHSAYFLQAFVNIGLVPDAGGTWLLPRLAGAQRAMGMALLGNRLSAAQALAWGMVWDVVEDGQFQQAVAALASDLAEAPAFAVSRIKQALHASDQLSLAESLQLESELQRECGAAPDFREGTRAFLEKRRARFNQ
jgi:2-(1,2-epoxy-1,2-dihydrophenyl)acetyl-CoA isomerase